MCSFFFSPSKKTKFEHDVASHSLSLSVVDVLEVGPWFWLDWCVFTCTLTTFKNGDVEPVASELPVALCSFIKETNENDKWCWSDVNVRSAPESPRLKSMLWRKRCR